MWQWMKWHYSFAFYFIFHLLASIFRLLLPSGRKSLVRIEDRPNLGKIISIREIPKEKTSNISLFWAPELSEIEANERTGIHNTVPDLHSQQFCDKTIG